MEENKHKYNSNDFVRYHQGTMPDDEMFALEKAALEDPFLADALDGYLFSKDVKAELSDIQIGLDERINSKKRGAVFQLSRSAWWRVAAMFTGIILVGYFFYQSGKLNTGNSIAQQESAKLKEQQTMARRAQSDTIPNKNDIAINEMPPLPGKENNKTEQNLFPENGREKDLEKVPAPILKRPVTSGSVSEVEPGLISDVASAKALNLHNAELRQKDDRDKLFAKAKQEKASMQIFPPSEKSLQARLKDTTISSASDAKDYAAMQGNSKIDSTNSLAFAKPELSEVVVSGYAKKQKSKDSGNISRELAGKVSGVSIGASTPYLLDGKENFDEYIKARAQSFSSLEITADSVDILLTFVLDKNKRPSKIKVIESNCKPCEAEATRLLKDGPKWGGERGSKGTINIRF